MKCRRCDGCQNRTHHWIPNSDFGNDSAEADHNPNVEYLCKHCEQEGYECPQCDGYGCDRCNHEGVLEVPF